MLWEEILTSIFYSRKSSLEYMALSTARRQLLIEAVKDGDLLMVKKLLAEGAVADVKDEQG